jgi:hypothetical protein
MNQLSDIIWIIRHTPDICGGTGCDIQLVFGHVYTEVGTLRLQGFSPSQPFLA